MKPLHILGAGLSGLSAAIVLAHAGREVHVHEIREDSGTRFEGDFQGIENWSPPGDLFQHMRAFGIAPEDFKATPFCEAELVDPNGRIHRVATKGPAFRIVSRGTSHETIDQGLKRQAVAAGATLHYRAHRSASECDIVATGPLGTTGVVHGELFPTSSPNRATLQFDDRLAPGGYTYLIVVDGLGLVATALLRKQRDPDRFLDETLAWYDRHYPDLDRQSGRRFGGHAAFALVDRHTINGRAWVGEAAGFQDCLWGFGMRQAIMSGAFAAKWLLGELDYETAVQRYLVPQLEASVANRWLLELFGPRGLDVVTALWLRRQRRNADGLAFLTRLYCGSPVMRLVQRLVRHSMLERRRLDDGRIAWIRTARPALPRDRWDPSIGGRRVAEQRAARRTIVNP